jgi:NarL family two-component system response regulator LiaR
MTPGDRIGSNGNSPSSSSRVLIVDDHPVLRRGLAVSLLAFPEFEVVGEAGSGEEALRLFSELRPDLVLMDLMMPGMGGVAAIRAIRALDPAAKILVLSNYPDGVLVQEALKAGAIGYELKGTDIDTLVNTIRRAREGTPTLAPVAAQALVRLSNSAPRLGDDLTAREREVLALLVRGLPNTAIAEALVVTEATVKFHVRGIRAKLGTATRTQTVAVALQHHLASTP